MLMPWTILKSNYHTVSKKCWYFYVSVILESLLIIISPFLIVRKVIFLMFRRYTLWMSHLQTNILFLLESFIELRAKFILNVILTRMNFSRVWNLHFFLTALRGLICDYNVALASMLGIGPKCQKWWPGIVSIKSKFH